MSQSPFNNSNNNSDSDTGQLSACKVAVHESIGRDRIVEIKNCIKRFMSSDCGDVDDGDFVMDFMSRDFANQMRQGIYRCDGGSIWHVVGRTEQIVIVPDEHFEEAVSDGTFNNESFNTCSKDKIAKADGTANASEPVTMGASDGKGGLVSKIQQVLNDTNDTKGLNPMKLAFGFLDKPENERTLEAATEILQLLVNDYRKVKKIFDQLESSPPAQDNHNPGGRSRQ